jgi:hypothetical protein
MSYPRSARIRTATRIQLPRMASSHSHELTGRAVLPFLARRVRLRRVRRGVGVARSEHATARAAYARARAGSPQARRDPRRLTQRLLQAFDTTHRRLLSRRRARRQRSRGGRRTRRGGRRRRSHSRARPRGESRHPLSRRGRKAVLGQSRGAKGEVLHRSRSVVALVLEPARSCLGPLRANSGPPGRRLRHGELFFQRPVSIFMPAVESSLCDSVTFGPSQELCVPLAGDLEVD